MARGRTHEPLRVERTRTSSTWVAISIAVVFLVFLIIFIAQNDRKVPLHFLGADGNVSEALALIVAAVAGAVFVLAAGAARIIQLRLVGRRHNREMAQQQVASPPAEAAPAAPTSVADDVAR
ncbi:MAG TPA: lipopolysaccharide assembly protein LapA domain-containing protein [Mycobacteriales bacterium]|nr:lipopolysaccharide assembly protein LapA domain-containing protein [Mycobacteriales bacterium]